MEHNEMKSNYLQAEMNQLAYENRVMCVAAEIYGEKLLLDETQVRALQVLCKRASDESDESWQEFVDNVVVYSTCCDNYGYGDMNGVTIDEFEFNGHVHKMIFNKDGRFNNSFDNDNGEENGFYTRNSELAFEIF